MFDPNTFTEGGGNFSLAGVEGIVVSSLFKFTNWADKDGVVGTYKTGRNAGQQIQPSTIWEIEVKTDDLDETVKGTIGVGGTLLPSKDGVMPAKDLTGPYLCNPNGKDASFKKNSGGAILVESLVNASFDFEIFNRDGVVALEGYRIAFDEIQRKDSKGQNLGKPTPVATKIIHGPGTSAAASTGKVAGKRTVAAPVAVVKGKAKAAPAPVEEETEEVDAETLVTEIIMEILAEESPLPKAKVSMKVNKALQEQGLEQADRLAALKLATSDEFLAAGEMWTYDKKSLAAL